MKFVVGSLLAMLAMVLALNAQETPKTIKGIMKAAHGGGKQSLLTQVIGGSASDARKKELLNLYETLAKTTAKKGDADSWKEKTAALVKAAQACVKGDAGAAKNLQALANCGACHKLHK